MGFMTIGLLDQGKIKIHGILPIYTAENERGL